MEIELVDIDGRRITPDKICELSLSNDIDAACDSIALKFRCGENVGEIVCVKAYNGSELVFNGLCDLQRMNTDKKGTEYYIYARSTACVLVDSQAEPFTYNSPTARQLFECNAAEFGFSYDAGEIGCNERYEVPQGTSCFGAINNFVSLLTDSVIYITPDNVIKVRSVGKRIKPIESYPVISVSYIINRSEPVETINFKRSGGDAYSLHTMSGLAVGKRISRRRYVNLSALPLWQRDKTIVKRLKASFDSYKLLEVKVSGAVYDELLSRFSFCDEAYTLVRKKLVSSADGEYTVLTLRQKLDLKEITYVD